MPDARGFGRSFGRAASVLLSAILLVAGPVPAVGQETEARAGLLSTVQVGPYVGITNQDGSNVEYALRLGTRTGPLRVDLAVGAVPWRTQLRCPDASSEHCRTRLIKEFLVGVVWSPWRHPDAPALGVRAGVTRFPTVVSGSETGAIIGPHVTLGLPTFARAGLRLEAGAVQRSAEGRGTTYRLYGLLGIQFHR